MPTQHLAEFSGKLDQAQRGMGWEDATKAVQSAAQNGTLPQTFSKAAQVVEQAYGELSDRQQRVIQDVSADTRNAIYMLAASFQQGDNEPGQVSAVQGLIDNISVKTT